MTMPKDWKPNRKNSHIDANDNYFFNSRNSLDNYSIDNEVNRNIGSNSSNSSNLYHKNNKQPLSINAKYSLGVGIATFIFWLFVGTLLNAFSDWFFWLIFFLFVIILPILVYGNFTSKSKRRIRRRT